MDAQVAGLFAGYEDWIAYRALLELWGVDYDPAAGGACAQAEAAGLHCYFQRGTLSTLRQLDRPVVLTLTDSDGSTHEMTLVALGDEHARLATASDSVTVSIDDLMDYWFGPFLLLWRPANGDDQALMPGMRSENVRWLRQSLAALDTEYRPAISDSDLFDAELEQQVMDFQRQHRLEADGLAGQKTQIIINTLLALGDRPRLTSIN